jgi:hypothetical protein
MRALLVVLVAGCVVQSTTRSDDPGGWILPGGTTQGHCQSDGACRTGEVCARNGACLPPSLVHPVHVTWTLRGMPASQTTCAAALDLQIGFYDKADPGASALGYAPVPCIEGKFTVDKLPTSYTSVKLGRDSGDHTWEWAMIDGTTGDAALDLPF